MIAIGPLRLSGLVLPLLLIACGGGSDAPPATPTPTPTPTPAPTPTPEIPSPEPDRFRVTETLFEDDFAATTRWHAEILAGGQVEAREGALVIDVISGCTVWFRERLTGPLMIEYEVTAVSEGGPNDRVSDINCWWMATDARSPDDLFATQRAGNLWEYDYLRAYYVSLGGNDNTTTRFRRYVGQPGDRPLLGTLTDPRYLITPNVAQRIQLVAFDDYIAYYRDGERYFNYQDSAPYSSGWFALRTAASHLAVRRFRIYRIAAR